MPASATQLESWQDCQENLGKNQRAVYSFIKKYGPITRRELREKMNWPSNSVTSRVTELLGMGMVAELPAVHDDVTNRNVAPLVVVAEAEWPGVASLIREKKGGEA